jgi:hypothetical protein
MSSSSNFAGLLRLEGDEESNSATAGSAFGTSMRLVGPTFASSASLWPDVAHIILQRCTTRLMPSQIIPQIFPPTFAHHQLHRMTFSPREPQSTKRYISSSSRDYLLISCRVLQSIRDSWSIHTANKPVQYLGPPGKLNPKTSWMIVLP